MALINTSGEPRTDDATSEVVKHHHLLVGGEWRKSHSSSLIQVFSTYASALSSMASANNRMTSLLAVGSQWDHSAGSSNAVRAACTAESTSTGSASGTEPINCSVSSEHRATNSRPQ